MVSQSTLDASHNGRELELMLTGKKPMAVFFKFSNENFDVLGGQDFQRFVESGYIKKRRFYVFDNDRGRNIVYTVFFREGDEWRFDCYKSLVKTLSNSWSIEKEMMSCLLLGYSVSESKSYIKDYIQYLSV